jgi:integrase
MMNLRVALEREYPDSPGTRNNYLVSLRAVLRECWAAGTVEEREYRRLLSVPLFSVPKHGPRPGRHVELDEVRRLVESIRQDTRPVGRRDEAIVAALFGAGLRRSEVVALRVADWTGRAFEVRNGKGGKSRTVPVPGWAARAVEAWLAVRGREDGVLFVSFRGCTWNHGGQHMRPTSIRDIIDHRLLEVGHREGARPGGCGTVTGSRSASSAPGSSGSGRTMPGGPTSARTLTRGRILRWWPTL